MASLRAHHNQILAICGQRGGDFALAIVHDRAAKLRKIAVLDWAHQKKIRHQARRKSCLHQFRRHTAAGKTLKRVGRSAIVRMMS